MYYLGFLVHTTTRYKYKCAAYRFVADWRLLGVKGDGLAIHSHLNKLSPI